MGARRGTGAWSGLGTGRRGQASWTGRGGTACVASCAVRGNLTSRHNTGLLCPWGSILPVLRLDVGRRCGAGTTDCYGRDGRMFLQTMPLTQHADFGPGAGGAAKKNLCSRKHKCFNAPSMHWRALFLSFCKFRLPQSGRQQSAYASLLPYSEGLCSSQLSHCSSRACHDLALLQCHIGSAWSVHPHPTTLLLGSRAVPNAPQARAAAPGLHASIECFVPTCCVPCRFRGPRREPDHPSGHSGRDLQRGSRHHDSRSRDVGRRDDWRPARRDERSHDDRSRRPHGREHTGRDKRKRDDEVCLCLHLNLRMTVVLVARLVFLHPEKGSGRCSEGQARAKLQLLPAPLPCRQPGSRVL